jgi:hypothetical protein
MSAPDLRVDVDQMPEPGLLRPAILAALHARPFPPGPEAEVGAAVARAVAAARDAHTRPSTGGAP